MSFQLSAQAITAQTAITRMSVRECSTLRRRRGSTTAPKCPTSRSMAMICFPTLKREDHLPPSNLAAIGFSCVAPEPHPDGQEQAAIYLDRAAHLRTLADAEADPILREQLRGL